MKLLNVIRCCERGRFILSICHFNSTLLIFLG